MNDKDAIKLLVGIFLSFVIAKVLKRIIKQGRPIKGKTYGMPSSRSTLMTFIVVFLLLSYNFKDKTKFIIIVLGLLTLFMKYYLKEHSFNQLLAGFILGLLIAYIIYRV